MVERLIYLSFYLCQRGNGQNRIRTCEGKARRFTVHDFDSDDLIDVLKMSYYAFLS